MKKVSLNIVSKPDYISYECPHCQYRQEISYKKFAKYLPKYWGDWEGCGFECPDCGKEIEIEETEYS